MDNIIFYSAGIATVPTLRVIGFLAYLIRVALHDVSDCQPENKLKCFFFFGSIKETLFGCMRGAWRVI